MADFKQRLSHAIYEVEDIRALHMSHVDHYNGFPEDVKDELTLPRHLSVIAQCNDVLDVLVDMKRGLTGL